jgi:peptidyl-tRNA hydrolase, PTH1 family
MSTEKREHLIFALGNPERDYGETRHNVGFLCVRELARRWDVQIKQRMWLSTVGHAALRDVWLVLPQTYMNDSGLAVAAALRSRHLTSSHVWVVHDELDLPLCRMRIKRDGSGAGHNGVQSVINALHSDRFVRFRVGVGKPAAKGSPAGIRHVLGRFNKEELKRVPFVINGVADALEFALEAGVERAMDRYNRAGALGCKETA